jgi:hypothetical protein
MDRNYTKLVNKFETVFWYEEDGFRVSFAQTPGNRHYEEYLLWLAEGNEPEEIN